MEENSAFKCWKRGCRMKPVGLKQFNPDFWRVYSCRMHAEALHAFQSILDLFKYWSSGKNELKA